VSVENIVEIRTKKFNVEVTKEANRIETVLHDMKSPLQTLKIISNGHLDNHPQKNEIEQRCFKQMQKIIDFGTQKKEVICLPNLVQSLKNQKIVELNTQIKIELKLNRAWVESDISREEIEIILSNLINNAHRANSLKHKSSSIKIKIVQNNSNTQFSIIDYGIGLGEEIHEIGKLNRTFSENGNGLGLNNLVRKAHQYGGSLFCRSLPSHGTQFILSLPF